MDAVAWMVAAAALTAVVVVVALAPRIARAERGRRVSGGGMSGVGAGFDAVWRPSAEEANARVARTDRGARARPEPGRQGPRVGPHRGRPHHDRAAGARLITALRPFRPRAGSGSPGCR